MQQEEKIKDANKAEGCECGCAEEPVKAISKEEVDKLIRYHMYSAFGVGLIPLPLLDLAALTAVQLNLLRKLAKKYEVPFFKDKVKNILSSLIAGTVPAAAGPSVASSIKFIPIVGSSLGAVSMPVIASAMTYAVGKVFNQHFASGGTFLTFDTEKVKDYYAKMFKRGKSKAEDIKKSDGAKDASEEPQDTMKANPSSAAKPAAASVKTAKDDKK